jgi:hypothetical protein
MDTVTEVQLQHKASQFTLNPDWCLQHVEVCNEVSGQTCYFLAGSWFSQLIQQQVTAGVKVAGGEDIRTTLALSVVTSNVYHKVPMAREPYRKSFIICLSNFKELACEA